MENSTVLICLGKAISNPFLLIFGNGPGKALSFEIIGQELTYYSTLRITTYLLYRYGIIGVIIFTFIFNLLKLLLITICNYLEITIYIYSICQL